LEPLTDPEEKAEVYRMIKRHYDYTGSHRAESILELWEGIVGKFVRVIPKDYKRMLECIGRAKDAGLTGDEAIMRAFEENKSDLARVGGN
jgi:glutamate synthase (ferredoxin)